MGTCEVGLWSRAFLVGDTYPILNFVITASRGVALHPRGGVAFLSILSLFLVTLFASKDVCLLPRLGVPGSEAA
jgi:uncharacterized membrane protein